MIGWLAAAAIVGGFASAAAAKLVADYRFDATHASAIPGAPDLTDAGSGNVFAFESPGGCRRPVLTFPADGGLVLEHRRLGPAQALHGDHAVPGRHRSAPRLRAAGRLRREPTSNDDGLYVYDGHLDWYDNGDTAGAAPISPDQFVEVAMIYGADRQVTVYQDGVKQISEHVI